MRLVDLNVDYIGADVVDELIRQNQRAYSNDRRKFIQRDLLQRSASDGRPRAVPRLSRALLQPGRSARAREHTPLGRNLAVGDDVHRPRTERRHSHRQVARGEPAARRRSIFRSRSSCSTRRIRRSISATSTSRCGALPTCPTRRSVSQLRCTDPDALSIVDRRAQCSTARRRHDEFAARLQVS